MNQCYGCNTCKSADKPLEGFIRSLPMETSHHRVEGQAQNVDLDCRGSVVVSAPTVLAALLQMRREESAVPMPIRS